MIIDSGQAIPTTKLLGVWAGHLNRMFLVNNSNKNNRCIKAMGSVKGIKIKYNNFPTHIYSHKK